MEKSQNRRGQDLQYTQVGAYWDRVFRREGFPVFRRDPVRALLPAHITRPPREAKECVGGAHRVGLSRRGEAKGAQYALLGESASLPVKPEPHLPPRGAPDWQVSKIKKWRLDPERPTIKQAWSFWAMVGQWLRPFENKPYQIIEQVACYLLLKALPHGFTQLVWGKQFKNMTELIELLETQRAASHSGEAEPSLCRTQPGYVPRPRPSLYNPELVSASAVPWARKPLGGKKECRWRARKGWCALVNPLAVPHTGVVIVNGHKTTVLFDSGSNISIVARRFVLPQQWLKFKTEYSRMTDSERDQIDQDAQILIRTCSDAINHLRTEGVCKLYSEQRAIRVKRVVDKKRLSRLEPEKRNKLVDSTPPKTPVISSTEQVDEKAIQDESTDKSNAETQDNNVALWEDGKVEDELSPEEIQMFEQENQRLVSEMNSLVDEVRQIEGKVVEISRLQEIFAEKVLQQTFRDKTLKVAEGCVDVTGVPRRRCFISQGTLDIIERSCSARLNGNSGLHRELRRMAARALRADKEVFVRGICEQVTHHIWSSDPHPAYRGIEALCTSESVPQRVAVRAADGTVLTDDTAVMTHWPGYIEQLFKADPPARTLNISGSTDLGG
ncbi:STX18 protein, partial [Polypterus senegalus]